ncbi:MAG: hypothetical protein P8L78_03410 [Mariniblastus sp.]|nr:hypothetical protein [Mariniblastus sp.]
MINNRWIQILPMLILGFALVGCTKDGKKVEQEITMPAEATSPASPADTEMAEKQFEEIKSLVGDWYLTGGNQLGKKLEPDPEVPFLTYATSAAGNCVIEKLFAGQTKEMTTVYFLDKGQLSMHHYCSLGNQPSMVAMPSAGDEIVFQLLAVGNMSDPNDLHISSHSLKFAGEDKLTALWGATKEQTAASSSVFNVERK